MPEHHPDALSGFDPAEFRKALGSFATGVTVVTTRGLDAEPIGLTVNSFNSVSLAPPMVLWSLARNALSLPAFLQARHWVVHVLAGNQEAMSKRFATKGADKFAGLALDTGAGEVPMLRGCAARFQCRTAFTYEGGDHVIFVGEVLDFDRSAAPPLVFHGGQYAAVQKAPQAGELSGSFAEDFLGYLLGRSHSQYYRQLKDHLRIVGIQDDEHIVLGALTTRGELSARKLEDFVTHLLSSDVRRVLDGLLSRGYIVEQPQVGSEPSYTLAPAGREFALRVIATAKAYEAHMIECFGNDDIVALKTLLRKLLTLTHSQSEQPSHGAAHG